MSNRKKLVAIVRLVAAEHSRYHIDLLRKGLPGASLEFRRDAARKLWKYRDNVSFAGSGRAYLRKIIRDRMANRGRAWQLVVRYAKAGVVTH